MWLKNITVISGERGEKEMFWQEGEASKRSAKRARARGDGERERIIKENKERGEPQEIRRSQSTSPRVKTRHDLITNTHGVTAYSISFLNDVYTR